jgi:hypothetical protein
LNIHKEFCGNIKKSDWLMKRKCLGDTLVPSRLKIYCKQPQSLADAVAAVGVEVKPWKEEGFEFY